MANMRASARLQQARHDNRNLARYEKDPTNSTPWRPNPPAVRASRSRALALMRRICPNKAQQLIEENGSGAVAEVEVVVPENWQAVESEEEEAGSREEEVEDEETDDSEEAVEDEELEAKDGERSAYERPRSRWTR
ncbi:uncharacterized protein LOC144542468 [Centroberyx gerrardi]